MFRQSVFRFAFSLIELVVAVSVVAVLVGLSLVSVQYARESARAMTCKSRLRQLALASHSYYEIHKMFPPNLLGTGSSPATPLWSANGMSVHVRLLPLLDENALYESINFDYHSLDRLGYELPFNTTVRQTRLANFLCPSGLVEYQSNSFRFNDGLFNCAKGPLPRFGLRKPVGASKGLSHIALISERIGGSFSHTHADPIRDIEKRAPGVPAHSTPDLTARLCKLNSPAGWYTAAGQHWYFEGYFNTIYSHDGPPNDDSPCCEFIGVNAGSGGKYGPRSFHSGFVHLAFCDSRVASISDHVDRKVWHNLAVALLEEEL